MQSERDGWTLLYAILLAATFVGYPALSSGLGALGAYAREFSIVYRAFAALGSIVLISLAATRMTPESWRGYVPLTFALLWAMMMARFVWDSSFVPIPLPTKWLEQFVMMVGAVLLPTIALFQAPSERAFDIARRIIFAVGSFAGVAVIVAVFRLVFEQNSVDALRRLGTDAFNPISVGNLGVILVIASLLAYVPKQEAGRFARFLDRKLVRAAAGVLGTLLVIASASKGPILELLVVVALSQAAQVVRRGSLLALFSAVARVTMLVLGLVALALFLGVFFNVRVVDRFVYLTADVSTSDRVLMITRALLQFESSPWVGSALVESTTRFYPHNLPVEVLMALGIPGFCALTVLLLAGLRAALRVLVTRHSWVTLLCAQYQVSAMFSGSVYGAAEFWASLGLVFAVDRMLTGQSARTDARDARRIGVPEAAHFDPAEGSSPVGRASI